MALVESQVLLHCNDKAWLYTIDMNIGNRIKIARERLRPKVTQLDVAKLFDITGSAVSEWERGITVPEHEKLPKLRKILKVTYVWLLEGQSEPPSPDDPQVRIEDLAGELEATKKSKPRRKG